MRLRTDADKPAALWERLAIAVFAGLVGAASGLILCCFALLVVGAPALVGYFSLEGISSLFARVMEFLALGSAVLAFFAPNTFIDAIGFVWDITYKVFQRLPKDEA